MKIKIFTKEDCPNCPPARDLGKILEAEGLDVEYHDISTIDGLTESSYHGIMSTPSVLVIGKDGKEKTGWRSTVPDINEIRQVLGK
ncbi:MAG: thioredoxin family protein [archaeon]